MYSVGQRFLVCCTLAAYMLWKKCHHKFCKIYFASAVPCKRTIYRIVETFCHGRLNAAQKENAEPVVLLQLLLFPININIYIKTCLS
jgi:hypothetical protein